MRVIRFASFWLLIIKSHTKSFFVVDNFNIAFLAVHWKTRKTWRIFLKLSNADSPNKIFSHFYTNWPANWRISYLYFHFRRFLVYLEFFKVFWSCDVWSLFLQIFQCRQCGRIYDKLHQFNQQTKNPNTNWINAQSRGILNYAAIKKLKAAWCPFETFFSSSV